MQKGRFRKVKNEISFKKSIFRFSTAFFIVLVAGIITNIYISKIDLMEKIPGELLETPDYQITIERPEIKFKNGLFPVVGVFSQRVEWKDKSCPSRRVVGQNVFLVMDFFALLQGRFEPGRVDVSFVDLVTPNNCGESSFQKNVADLQDSDRSEKLKPLLKEMLVKELFPKKIFSSVKEVLGLSFFPMVYIHKFDFKFMKAYREEVEVKGSLSIFRGDRLSVKMFVNKLFLRGYELPLRKSSVEVIASNDAAELKVNTNVREGVFQFNLNLDNSDDFQTSAEMKVLKMPLSPFSAAVLKKTHISYLWFDCKAQVSGTWAELDKKEFSLEKCELTGPYGAANVNKSSLTLGGLKELEVEFNKIQVDEVLDNKRDAYFSGVFSKYGSFSSLLKLNESRWSLEGFLEDSEVIFSRNNLRDIQKIKKMPFKAGGRKKEGRVVIENIDLDNGQFKGDLVVEFKNGMEDARGRFSIHKLLMNPKIYKLMFLSQPTPLSFYGKLELKDRKIKDWSGVVAAKDVEGEEYKFSALKIEGQMGDDKSSLFKFTVPSGQFSPKSNLVKWVRTTTLVDEWPEEEYKFKEFSGRLKLGADRSLSLKRGYLRFANSWQLSGEGSVDSESSMLDAWIQWDKPRGPYLKWSIKDRFLSGRWEPQTEWAKEWLIKNPGYIKDNNNILFEQPVGAKDTQGLNDVGKKTLEKVKDVLSIKKPSPKKKGS